MIRTQCEKCGKRIEAPEAAAGKKGKCPKCGEVVTVPKPATRPPIEPIVEAPFKPPVHVVAFPPPAMAPAYRPPMAVAYVPPPQLARCPFCSEDIKPEAKKCKHCGEILDPTLRMASQAPPPAQFISAPAQPVNVTTTVHTHQVMNVVGGSQRRWSPATAALLSFLIPGLGQCYKGQIFNGLAWFFVVLVGYVALVVPGLVLHLCCVIGASRGDPYR